MKVRDLIPEAQLAHRIYLIYLDIDGVFSDFIKKASDILGRPYDPKTRSREEEEFFWKKIKAAHEKGKEFWSEMDLLPDANRLWDYVKHSTPIFLTSTGRDGPQLEGKRQKIEWVRKHFGNYKVIVVNISAEKSKYASKNAILIDDTPKNVATWKKAGGIGILHKNATDTIKQLKELGL